jgi:hypothetical protein
VGQRCLAEGGREVVHVCAEAEPLKIWG